MVVTSWVDSAAREIAKRGSLDEREIAEIIAKWCPFELGVAYEKVKKP